MASKTKKLIGVAAVAATGAMLTTPAQAVPRPVPLASSYADLLLPVPDAASRLAADDAAMPAQEMGGRSVDHHHHHHHHHHNRAWYRQHGYWWNGRAWVIRPVRHHHHHHHHDHN